MVVVRVDRVRMRVVVVMVLVQPRLRVAGAAVIGEMRVVVMVLLSVVHVAVLGWLGSAQGRRGRREGERGAKDQRPDGPGEPRQPTLHAPRVPSDGFGGQWPAGPRPLDDALRQWVEALGPGK